MGGERGKVLAVVQVVLLFQSWFLLFYCKNQLRACARAYCTGKRINMCLSLTAQKHFRDWSESICLPLFKALLGKTQNMDYG